MLKAADCWARRMRRSGGPLRARHRVDADAGLAMTRTNSKRRESQREDKKKARRMSDAPSNKTYGNCLLGFHCIQKTPAGDRAVAGFLAVARRQQEKLSPACSQSAVERLGVISTRVAQHLNGPTCFLHETQVFANAPTPPNIMWAITN